MLTALGSGPSDLYAALPIAGDTIGVRKTSAGQTVYYAVLDEPLRDRTADPDQYTAARCGEDSAGRFVWVSDVVFRPVTPGAVPHFGMQGFPIELAYVLDPEIRRSDGVIAADALDFAASGFIDDIDTAAVPPPAPNATDVDVDFDDHAPAASDPAAKPPNAPPRRPLIDLPPLADELDVDQELLTVPAAAPVTGVERRSLIDLPPLADELDEDGDLGLRGQSRSAPRPQLRRLPVNPSPSGSLRLFQGPRNHVLLRGVVRCPSSRVRRCRPLHSQRLLARRRSEPEGSLMWPVPQRLRTSPRAGQQLDPTRPVWLCWPRWDCYRQALSASSSGRSLDVTAAKRPLRQAVRSVKHLHHRQRRRHRPQVSSRPPYHRTLFSG